MGRVINTESAAKDRTRLTRSIILALRELMRQNEPNEDAKDLAAYISLALSDVYDTIESSVAAWEKKGYWVKADRFRLDWEWAQYYSRELRSALERDDWGAVATYSAQTAQKLMKVSVPIRHHLGTPWVGAWTTMKQGR